MSINSVNNLWNWNVCIFYKNKLFFPKVNNQCQSEPDWSVWFIWQANIDYDYNQMDIDKLSENEALDLDVCYLWVLMMAWWR